ncbi:hypothetical protein OCS_06513 [Ophiocordyceps sinensis CO18]|uniref:Uncharacterized protein n=1 Tax=Ophiocordyceps sinensis (strain Co18 / CGMCC 3.14243) TaxID=911162 RepID=T4ZXB7_OPHSC|nr:hypothetical protein OCS_06513 [Ophiocordyceps sinensis CO18]
MATVKEQQQMCRPPTPEASPTLTPGSCPELSRCLSIGSSASNTSHSHLTSRGSQSGDVSSRHSSASYHSQASDTSTLSGPSGHGTERKSRRRGYVRPQPTDFAASARSRESVMSLGSIAHLQYYFARTGLLDGKGAQLARKKLTQRATLDLPDLAADALDTASPLEMDNDYYEDSFAESDSDMLPPTVSTYHHKDLQVPKLPTMAELKTDLETTLHDAAKALSEARRRKAGTYEDSADAPQYPNMPEEKSRGWYELQGMHMLDVVTLAIRAAKIYYTTHELPERLDSIKSEKQVRADLLGVMEVLKQMATRGFKGGLRDEEIKTMNDWIGGVLDMLTKEEDLEAAERAERVNWTWLHGDWSGREYERERSFLMSMAPEGGPLAPWTPLPEASETPTPFLESMQNGLRLVRLHNAVVNKSRRRFGAIPSFHVDTQKPYRCADNLRYWVKAAELRFEVLLRVDALGVVYNSGPQAWADFEAAILEWCRHVREEIAGELDI